MKRVKPFISFAILLFLFSSNAYSQSDYGDGGGGGNGTVLGPYNTYVSQQQPNAGPIFSGSSSASADEGRVININIKNIQGAITINPMSFSLTGPPCPTYDSHGRRTPEEIQPPKTDNFSGNVLIDPNNFPTPGTMVQAQFSGQDDGYWTKCSDTNRLNTLI